MEKRFSHRFLLLPSRPHGLLRSTDDAWRSNIEDDTFTLHIHIHVLKKKMSMMREDMHRLMISLVPLYTWCMLLCLNGQYVACARTDWEGRYVVLDNAGPRSWCEPLDPTFICLDHKNLTSRQGCMLKTQQFFVESQWLGIGCLSLLCLGFIIYGIKGFIQGRPMDASDSEATGHKTADTSQTTTDADLTVQSSQTEAGSCSIEEAEPHSEEDAESARLLP